MLSPHLYVRGVLPPAGRQLFEGYLVSPFGLFFKLVSVWLAIPNPFIQVLTSLSRRSRWRELRRAELIDSFR